MKINQININNNYQINKFQNSLNLKVKQNRNFNNDMIDYGIIIINKAYNLMNKGSDRAKYIAQSFDSKYPQKGNKWMCFIFKSLSYYSYSTYSIKYDTGKEKILIFV
jgi:hypothetical protein